MGKSTISMAIFNSYVKLPEGNPTIEHKYEVCQMISDQNRRNRLSISCWALPLLSALGCWSSDVREEKKQMPAWQTLGRAISWLLVVQWGVFHLLYSTSQLRKAQHIHDWLVVLTILKNMSSSMGFGWHPIYEMANNPAMFQTTNKMIKSNCLSAVSFLTFFAPHVSSSKVCRAFNGSSVYFQLE